ncbi:MAG TPA: hypothetical protein VEB68_02150 [Croceibacterium sp.]|nr:hypothetical protein [Croceibacterium sp.]
MTDQPLPSGERPPADQAPELHNAEQDDELEQSQTVAEEALRGGARESSPLDSLKADEPGEVMDDSAQDLIDKMRDMEQSGRIDMDAYLGEPNHDDNEDKYGDENKLTDLPADGSDEGNALGDEE